MGQGRGQGWVNLLVYFHGEDLCHDKKLYKPFKTMPGSWMLSEKS